MKIGDIVEHKLTKEHVMIIGKMLDSGDVIIRLPNYGEIIAKEIEVTPILSSKPTEEEDWKQTDLEKGNK